MNTTIFAVDMKTKMRGIFISPTTTTKQPIITFHVKDIFFFALNVFYVNILIVSKENDKISVNKL